MRHLERRLAQEKEVEVDERKMERHWIEERLEAQLVVRDLLPPDQWEVNLLVGEEVPEALAPRYLGLP